MLVAIDLAPQINAAINESHHPDRCGRIYIERRKACSKGTQDPEGAHEHRARQGEYGVDPTQVGYVKAVHSVSGSMLERNRYEVVDEHTKEKASEHP